MDWVSLEKAAVRTEEKKTPQKTELISNVYVKGHSVDFKVETGAKCNVISEDLFVKKMERIIEENQTPSLWR